MGFLSRIEQPPSVALGFGIVLASTEGFEPSTDGLEGHCSVQLSYVEVYVR